MTEPSLLNPLSDVVISWLFSSTDENMDIAACELINAVLSNAGQPLIKEVVELRSQYGIPGFDPTKKAVRLDVFARSFEGKLISFEVMLGDNRDFNDRTLFNASKLMIQEAYRGAIPHIDQDNPESNDPKVTEAHYRRSPQVIMINILRRELKNDHPDFHQPLGFCYLHDGRLASQKILAHNIELAKFLRIEHPDLSNPLQLWLHSLTSAYKNPATRDEVMAMSPGLHAFLTKYNRADLDSDLRLWQLKSEEGLQDQLV